MKKYDRSVREMNKGARTSAPAKSPNPALIDAPQTPPVPESDSTTICSDEKSEVDDQTQNEWLQEKVKHLEAMCKTHKQQSEDERKISRRLKARLKEGEDKVIGLTEQLTAEKTRTQLIERQKHHFELTCASLKQQLQSAEAEIERQMELHASLEHENASTTQQLHSQLQVVRQYKEKHDMLTKKNAMFTKLMNESLAKKERYEQLRTEQKSRRIYVAHDKKKGWQSQRDNKMVSEFLSPLNIPLDENTIVHEPEEISEEGGLVLYFWSGSAARVGVAMKDSFPRWKAFAARAARIVFIQITGANFNPLGLEFRYKAIDSGHMQKLKALAGKNQRETEVDGFYLLQYKGEINAFDSQPLLQKVNVNATERLGSILNAMFPPEQPRSRVQTEEEKIEKCEEILKEPVEKSRCFIM